MFWRGKWLLDFHSSNIPPGVNFLRSTVKGGSIHRPQDGDGLGCLIQGTSETGERQSDGINPPLLPETFLLALLQ